VDIVFFYGEVAFSLVEAVSNEMFSEEGLGIDVDGWRV
jgi:hypothetical protein